MANVFLIIVATPGNGTGASLDVSALQREKTVIVTGVFDGLLFIEGSTDGVEFSPLSRIDGGIVATAFAVAASIQFLRARRTESAGVGIPIIGVGGPDFAAAAADTLVIVPQAIRVAALAGGLTSDPTVLWQFDVSGGAVAQPLQAALGRDGQSIIVQEVTGTAGLTLTPDGADSINGIAGAFTIPGGGGVWLVSDDVSDWRVLRESPGSIAKAGTETQRIIGAILADGIVGATPVAGAGSRFMYIPAKRAIRAGEVSAGQWDDANIGDRSVAFGYNCTASGSNALAVGNSCTASNSFSVAIGSGSLAMGLSAFAVNLGCIASAQSAMARGSYSRANRMSQLSYGSGLFLTLGDAQGSDLTVMRQTTDGAVTVLTIGGGIPAGVVITTSNRIILEDDTSYMFEIFVSARRVGVANESAGYRFLGVIDRQVGAGTTALVGAVSKVVFEDIAAWDADVVADAANGALQVQVTGVATQTINWVATVHLTKTQG